MSSLAAGNTIVQVNPSEVEALSSLLIRPRVHPDPLKTKEEGEEVIIAFFAWYKTTDFEDFYEVGFTKKFQNFSKTIITPNYAIFDAQDE